MSASEAGEARAPRSPWDTGGSGQARSRGLGAGGVGLSELRPLPCLTFCSGGVQPQASFENGVQREPQFLVCSGLSLR